MSVKKLSRLYLLMYLYELVLLLLLLLVVVVLVAVVVVVLAAFLSGLGLNFRKAMGLLQLYFKHVTIVTIVNVQQFVDLEFRWGFSCSNQEFFFFLNRVLMFFYKHEETIGAKWMRQTEAPKWQTQPPNRWMLHVDLDLRLAAVALLVFCRWKFFCESGH